MKNRIADFCFRWSVAFGLVLTAAFLVSGIAMHAAVLRIIWKWL